MTRAADYLDQMLTKLKIVEDALEHENTLNPDQRLNDAEIAVQACIVAVEKAAKGLAPGEKWDCAKRGHVDTGGMFAFTCKYCDYSEHMP